MRVPTVAALLLAGLLFGGEVLADEPRDAARSWLSFESLADGKCHILSEGGKLRVMVNNHPHLRIRYRLMRYFVDVPQQGRATGIAEPAGAPVKLGCTRVQGRPQRWEIERAEFIEEP